MTEHFVTTLGEICEFRYGKPLPAETRRGGHVAVFGSNGVVGHHDVALVSGPSIIVGRKGSSGEVHYSATDSWPIDTTYFVDSTATKTDLKWLSYALRASRLKELSQAAAVPGLNRNDAYRLPIILPPLDEQRRIAAILDKADALRQKRKRAIALLDSLTQSIFEAAVLKGNPPIRPLSGSLEFITSGGRNWTKYIVEQGQRFIRSFDVQNGWVSNDEAVFVMPPDNAEAKRTRTLQGDVLLTITGSRIGRASSLPDDMQGCYISQHVAILRLKQNKLLPSYLSSFLTSEQGQRQIAKWQYGQTKPGLNFEQIGRFEIPMLTTDEQADFVERTTSLATHKSMMQHSASKAETLFASLQDRAFSGQL